MKFSSNFGNSNDENNLMHKFLLTNTQVSRLHKAFENNSSANTKLPIRILSRLLGSLLKAGLPLLKNTFKPSVKAF